MSYFAIFVVWVLGVLFSVPASQAQERLYRVDPDLPIARSEKINPNLRAMAQELSLRGISTANARSAGASDLSHGFTRVDDSAAMQTYIHVEVVEPRTLEELSRLGVRIEISNPELKIVQGWIPFARLDAVAALPFVTRVTVPSFGTTRLAPCVADNAETCRTEGDVIHQADALRAEGFDGSDVRVGVISDGIDSLCDAVASMELPSNITAYGTCNDANPCGCSDGDEGTAMLEIIHDMAPGATLGFGSGIISSLNFIQRVKDLTEDFQADIIVDDIGFFLEPYFEDGPIAQNVRNAIDQGVFYFSAAGNQALDHYEGDYVDSGDGLGSHQIADGNHVFNIYGFINTVVILQWSNPFGQASDDYDLCFEGESAEDCAANNVQQNGNDDPLEYLVMFCGFNGCPVQVRRVSGKAQRLELFVLEGGLDPADQVLSGSIFGHPAVTGAFAVAAVDVLEPGNDAVEPFSSRGPSRIDFPALEIRNKPDITATDGVEVGGFGGFPTPFFGTSAAAPHVAALAAQLLSGLGPAADIHQALKDGAIDIEEQGYDFQSGFGRMDAPGASSFLQKTPQSAIDSPTGDLTFELGESVNFSGSCTSFDGSEASSFLWTFGEGSGISDSEVEDPGSLTFNVAGDFEVTFTCTDGSGISDNTPATRRLRVAIPPAPAEPTPSPEPSPTVTPAESPDSTIKPPPSASSAAGGCSLTLR